MRRALAFLLANRPALAARLRVLLIRCFCLLVTRVCDAVVSTPISIHVFSVCMGMPCLFAICANLFASGVAGTTADLF